MTLLHSNRHFRLLLLTGVLTVLSITLSPAADPPAAKPAESPTTEVGQKSLLQTTTTLLLVSLQG